MTSINVGFLRSCDSCGSSLIRPDEYYCDPCLITYCQTMISTYRKDNCLDAQFQAKMLQKYQARLDRLQLRSPVVGLPLNN